MERDEEERKNEAQKQEQEKGPEQAAPNPANLAAFNQQEERRLDKVEYYFTFDVAEQMRQQQEFEAAQGRIDGQEMLPGDGPHDPRRRPLAECDVVKVWGCGHFSVYHTTGPHKGLTARTFWGPPKYIGCFPSHVARIEEIKDKGIIQQLQSPLRGPVMTHALQYFFRYSPNQSRNPYIAVERGTAPTRLLATLGTLIDVCDNADTFKEWECLQKENPDVFEVLQTMLDAGGALLKKRLAEVDQRDA